MNSAMWFDNQANSVDWSNQPTRKKDYSLMNVDELNAELRLEAVIYQELKYTFNFTKDSNVTGELIRCARRKAMLRSFIQRSASPHELTILGALEVVREKLTKQINDHENLKKLHENLKRDKNTEIGKLRAQVNNLLQGKTSNEMALDKHQLN